MILLPIFERADRRSPVVARVAPGNPERALKTTGGVPYQIVVLDRQPGWFRVARAEQIPGEIGPAWLAESPVWRFHHVTNDAERRALGRDAWGPDNPDVRVLGTQRIGDALWVNIEVLDHSICVGKTPIVRQRGWIPAHAPSGKLNIWYIPPRWSQKPSGSLNFPTGLRRTTSFAPGAKIWSIAHIVASVSLIYRRHAAKDLVIRLGDRHQAMPRSASRGRCRSDITVPKPSGHSLTQRTDIALCFTPWG